jgi:hypothetical protein
MSPTILKEMLKKLYDDDPKLLNSSEIPMHREED